MNIKNQLSTAAAGGSQLGSGLRRTLCLLALVAFYAVGKASETAVYIYDGKEYSAKERQALLVLVHQGNLSSRTVDTGTMYTNSDGIDLVCLNSSEGIFLVPTTITPDNDLSISLTSSTQSWTNLKYPNLSGVTKIHLRFRVAVNVQNFPDENFRNYVLAQSYGSDAVLTKEEIASVTEINVGEKSISNLKGIEYFTALTTLLCNKNKLKSLDLSKNTALEQLSCYGNQLTSLDLSKNTALTYLRCESNKLTSLDLSKNTVLTYLHCGNNKLTSLDVSKNTALTTLNCYINQLASLDISKNTALTELDCNSNQLTSLDLSNNTALTRLDCYSNPLTSLDVSKNTALTDLDCSDNQLTTLDVSKNTALTSLICGGNKLTSLDVSKNTALTQLSCPRNQLTTLDLSENTALTYLLCHINQIRGAGMVTLINSLPNHETGGCKLYVYFNNSTEGNQITTAQVAAAKKKGWSVLDSSGSDYPGVPGIAIDATNFPDEIFRAYVSGNTIDQDGDGYLTDEEIAGVTSINVSGEGIFSLKGIEYFTALKTLKCVLNDLTSLDVSKNTALEELICNDNGLRTLDVTGCTALEFLECHHNGLTTLDVSKNKALRSLDCNQNQLISLDLPESTELTLLVCYINQLTKLDVSNNTALTGLYCNDNQLKSLDVSKNTKLTELYCYSNQLTSLDVSKNTALEWLSCYDNQLTSLNLPETTSLTHLICFNNQLTMLDVSGCTALTSLSCEGNQLTSLDLSKNTALKGLDCYNNLIRGEGMAALVNSLPDRSATSAGSLTVYYNETPMGNMMTEVQVAAAKAKNWIPKQWDDNLNSWVDYDGEEAADGDANGDSILDADDLEIIRNYILGIVPEYIDEDAADVNGDGVVDIVDLTKLIQLLTE